MRPAIRIGRLAAFAILMLASPGWDYEAATASADQAEQVWSFDMWCLEMQLYPQRRCDARRPEDVTDYERYRARTDRYQEPRAAKEKRDQELLQQLNQNVPGGTREPPVK